MSPELDIQEVLDQPIGNLLSKHVDVETITPKDTDKTGGLPQELEIFIGAKVMLQKNIDRMLFQKD